MKQLYFKNKQAGAFLLELMIGLMMSMIIILAVFAVYIKFETYKRTTTHISQTMGDGSIGIQSITHFSKMAGYGLNSVSFFGCNVHAYNSEISKEYFFPLKPLTIVSKDNNQSDEIIILVGDSNHYYSAQQLSNVVPQSSKSLTLSNTYRLNKGDVFIIGEQNKDCSLRQISDINNNIISYNSVSYEDNNGDVKETKFNTNMNLATNYSRNALFLPLGPSPIRLKYTVENKQLIQTELFSGEEKRSVLINNAVILKSLYGLDNNLDGHVDEWSAITPSKPETIIAVSLGVIIQSSQRESSCNITSNSEFQWLGGIMDISELDDWQCYRYRLFQTVIPMRNVFWRHQ